MTVKSKLFINAAVILFALTVIVAAALLGARETRKSIAELTEKTSPYQIKALNHQKELQAHTANLVSLAAAKTPGEHQKLSQAALDTLARISLASSDLARLKGEPSREDRTIGEITQAISEKTASKINSQASALAASLPIGEKLSKSLGELQAFVDSIQKKGSGNIGSSVTNLLSLNDQYQQLGAVKDRLNDLAKTTLQMTLAAERRTVSELRDQAGGNLKAITDSLRPLKDLDKNNELLNKTASIRERITGGGGLAALHLKSPGAEEKRQREAVEVKTKEAITEINEVLDAIERHMQKTGDQLKGHMSDIYMNQHGSKNTTEILSLTSAVSIYNASIISHIQDCIYTKDRKELERLAARLKDLFEKADETGEKARNLLFNADYGDGIVKIAAYQKTLSEVMASLFNRGGVLDKIRTSLANGEELGKLQDRMNAIAAQHLEASNREVSKAGASQDEEVASLNQTAGRMILTIAAVGGVAVFLTLLLGFLINRSVTNSIKEAVESITDASEQVASASSQVSSASQSLAEGSSEQAAGLEEVSSSIEEMASMAKQNAENAREADLLSQKGIELMKGARNEMKSLMDSIDMISRASEETGKIVKEIDGIAFQTNLLALNAAVEAARAGEAGAGFAVVAEQVRNLALQAAQAAKNTSALVTETMRLVGGGVVATRKTDESYREVAVVLKKVVDLVGEIATASSEQAQGVEQVSKALAEVDRVVQNNAATAEESAAAAEEMQAQTEQMSETLEQLAALVERRNGGGDAALPETEVRAAA